VSHLNPTGNSLLTRSRNSNREDMVTVLVGETLVPFGIHKNYLVAHSPVMTAGLYAVLPDQPPNVVKLPNDDPNIFSYIPYWMYEHRFPMVDSFIQSCIDTGSDPYATLIEVYALGIKLQMHSLKEDVLHALEWAQKATNTLPSLRNMNRAWQITHGQANQALRYMFCDWYVYFLRSLELVPDLRTVLSRDVSVDLMCAYAQFATGCDCQEGRIPGNWETYAVMGAEIAKDEHYCQGVKIVSAMPRFVRK
jgi:hypothetical protein